MLSHLTLGTHDFERACAFHAAMLDRGGTDEGTPGPRPRYHAGYCGASVRDPDDSTPQACIHDHRA